jgi:16S rRNA A1518/A1519 N6-dimethyltransferase RsmA/KsgA/DIM1 with predicted DNA glycosylase/AP lyase activity
MNSSFFNNDSSFDWLYPQHLQLISNKHWTPISIARKAAKFLALPSAKVLDIGSGIGKFCLTAAFHHPLTSFYGVEQRHELIHFAEEAKNYIKLRNANFIHANFTQVNFESFDHFYFYNSFWENIDHDNKIDDTIETSFNLYNYYTQYLFNILNTRPSGTRLVTFQAEVGEIPANYMLVETSENSLLRMWIKA